jgi:tetratricopeptide (TPR) repeat protein
LNRYLLSALTVSALCLFEWQARAAGPTSWEQAKSLYESGNYKQALSALESMNSSNASVHYLMGMCYKNLGNVGQAKKELIWVEQYSPDVRVRGVAHDALEQSGQAAAAPKPPVFSKLMYMKGAPGNPVSQSNIAAAPPTNATTSEAARLGWRPCPGNCLKATTPGWHKLDVAGHPASDNWITFDYREPDGTSAHSSFSQLHIGHIIQSFPDKAAVDSGPCPICGGTGWVRANK